MADTYNFSAPRYFEMREDGVLVEVDHPTPVMGGPRLTVTSVDASTGVITLEDEDEDDCCPYCQDYLDHLADE